jgi:hypothetical protein
MNYYPFIIPSVAFNLAVVVNITKSAWLAPTVTFM